MLTMRHNNRIVSANGKADNARRCRFPELLPELRLENAERRIAMNVKIFTDDIEQKALEQVETLCRQPAFADCKVRIQTVTNCHTLEESER